MDVVGLAGNFASLAVALCGVLFVTLIPAFFLSIPGWLTGRIAAPNSPQLKKVRKSGHYWAAWVLLGGIPLALGVTGGPLAGANHFLPTPAAIALTVLGLVVLNVNSFLLGYKQGLAAKAKKEISKSLKENLGRTSRIGETVDLLDENHPAIASTPGGPRAATTPLPVVDAHRPFDGDAPTQEIATHDAAPLNDEYPTARPLGE